MGKMILQTRKEFDRLHARGMQALDAGRTNSALKIFEDADTLARLHNDRRKRLDALNPLAHSLWELGEYDKAKKKLNLAAKIARELRLWDELAIIISNQGRLTAVRIVRQTAVSGQTKELHKEALPYFTKAQKMLEDHNHLYFRYANATYGALVAALAQDYTKAAALIAEGYSVAFKKTLKYDKKAPATISASGLERLSAAAQVVDAGVKNSSSRECKKQEENARKLIK